jgi:hypothetical protein
MVPDEFDRQLEDFGISGCAALLGAQALRRVSLKLAGYSDKGR